MIKRVPTFNIYWALGFLGLSFISLSQKLEKPKMGCRGYPLIFPISFVNEFVSKIWHMGLKPSRFSFRFSWLFSFFMLSPSLSSDEAEDRYFQTNQLHHRLGLLLSVVYLFSTSMDFISKTPTASDQPFPPSSLF